MLTFDNSYARLPDRFYARVAPTKVGDPHAVRVNRPLPELLGVLRGRLGAKRTARIFRAAAWMARRTPLHLSP